jgi:ribokinase
MFDHIDAFMPSEIELDTHGDSPEVAMRRIEGDRLRWVFLKRGAAGGLILDRKNDKLMSWPTRAERVVDTTGAGDGFAGGFLAAWVTHGDLQRSIEQGVVSASFAIEEWGARRIIQTTSEQADTRRREWYPAVRYDSVPRVSP